MAFMTQQYSEVVDCRLDGRVSSWKGLDVLITIVSQYVNQYCEGPTFALLQYS